MEKVRVHMIISGRVQGVFFRQNTLNKAKELGVFGWVKNLEDGRVQAIFEGYKGDIEKIIDWVRQGPALAKVEKVEIDWQDYKGEFKDFKMEY